MPEDLDSSEDEFTRIVFNEWKQHPQTIQFLTHLKDRRAKLLEQAEEYANSPGTSNNLAHMQNLLVMARTIRTEITNYAQSQNPSNTKIS